jgi:hypothetical protein
MKFVFKRYDQYARRRPNRCGEQKGNKCDRSDDPRIMEGTTTRPLKGASFQINPFRRSKLSQIKNSGTSPISTGGA